jgi:hypothetical protein
MSLCACPAALPLRVAIMRSGFVFTAGTAALRTEMDLDRSSGPGYCYYREPVLGGMDSCLGDSTISI